MKTMDRATLAEWTDLELDGQLGSDEQALLAERLAADTSLAADRRRLEDLHVMLKESRIAVRPGFRDEVMAALPASARAPAWALPLAAMVALAAAAALVLGSAEPAESHVWATGVAILEFVKTTALAGAGLLVVSWRGLGLALEELITSSGAGLAAMAVLVLCVNLLFIHMMRRKPNDVQPLLERASTEDPGPDS